MTQSIAGATRNGARRAAEAPPRAVSAGTALAESWAQEYERASRPTRRRYFDAWFDASQRTYWAMLRPQCPPKFTTELLAELRSGQRQVQRWLRVEVDDPEMEVPLYQVFGSQIPGVFSLGGDLELFHRLISKRDREGLERYARACVDVVYTNAVNYGLGITTISLVQGQALGGGFEAALAANVVVAERGCRMGFPEVLFNLFPGMGAYQLLTRRVSSAAAERLIASGRTYRAEELHEMGLVDVIAPVGEGEAAVRGYIRTHARSGRGRRGLRRAIQRADPIDYEALIETVQIWVETALELEPRDLAAIEYLRRAQRKLAG